MASFQYTGTREGKSFSGVIEADDRRQAITLLARQGVQLQELAESHEVEALKKKMKFRKKKTKKYKQNLLPIMEMLQVLNLS